MFEDIDPISFSIQLARNSMLVARLRYVSYEGEETLRDIDIYSYDNDYIDTWCRLRNEPRTFRIDRILRLDVSNLRFDPIPERGDKIKAKGLTKASRRYQRSVRQMQEDYRQQMGRLPKRPGW